RRRRRRRRSRAPSTRSNSPCVRPSRWRGSSTSNPTFTWPHRTPAPTRSSSPATTEALSWFCQDQGMEPLEIIRLVLLAGHVLGLAAIIGTFFVQMRAKENFATGVVLAGAITQVVTGLALVGVSEAGGGDVNHIKIAVKASI